MQVNSPRVRDVPCLPLGGLWRGTCSDLVARVFEIGCCYGSLGAQDLRTCREHGCPGGLTCVALLDPDVPLGVLSMGPWQCLAPLGLLTVAVFARLFRPM